MSVCKYDVCKYELCMYVCKRGSGILIIITVILILNPRLAFLNFLLLLIIIIIIHLSRLKAS